MAAFLDPNEYPKLRKRPNDLQNALALLKIEMYKETLRTIQDTSATNSVNVTTTSDSNIINSRHTNVKNDIDTLFSLCGVESSPADASSLTTTLSVDEEIGFYVSFVNGKKQVKFDHFWTDYEKHLPLMSAVVRRVNIIPASAVPCESTFSVAGYIRRKQRSSLSSTALRYSLVLKDRHKLELLKH